MKRNIPEPALSLNLQPGQTSAHVAMRVHF